MQTKYFHDFSSHGSSIRYTWDELEHRICRWKSEQYGWHKIFSALAEVKVERILCMEGKEGSYRAAQISWKSQTIVSVFGEISPYQTWVNKVWDVEKKSSSSLFFCCLQCSTFCHSPFCLNYFLHPHMLTKPSFLKHILCLASKISFYQYYGYVSLPSIPSWYCNKVNYDWIEGKFVSLGLYTRNLESHSLKQRICIGKLHLQKSL